MSDDLEHAGGMARLETDMPLRPARAARRGVVGRPAVRTAAAVGTVAVAAHGVNRRRDRRADRSVDDRRDGRGLR